MKRVYLFVFLLLGYQAHAQQPDSTAAKDTSYWKHDYSIGLNGNQAQFTKNWKAGGVNAIAFSASFMGKSTYEKYKWTFISDLQLQYGLVKNEGQGERKNIDRVFYDALIGYKVAPKWLANYNLNYLSQFDAGYAYSTDAQGTEVRTLISRLMAPGFVTQALGVQWQPAKYFKVNFGLATLRTTFVLDTLVYSPGSDQAFGVTKGRNTRTEVAHQIVAEFDKDIAKNVNLKWRFWAFKAYDRPAAFEHIDTRLDLVLTGKINNWMNASLTVVGIYDRDQDKALQLSQVIALGVLYKFK